MTAHIERAPRMHEAPEYAERIRDVQQLLRSSDGRARSGLFISLTALLAVLGACMFAFAVAVKVAPGSAAAQLVLALFQ